MSFAHETRRDQSMKIDDWKSIDQSISIDNCWLIDIDWHRTIDDQSIATNEMPLITSIATDCYRLPLTSRSADMGIPRISGYRFMQSPNDRAGY